MANIVLVLEDEPLLSAAIAKKLTHEGFDVVAYSKVADALAYLKGAQQLPVVVWLDFYLPDGNGIAFMEAFTHEEKWRDIPVIVVSNSARDEHVKAMLSLGVKKYLLKAEVTLERVVSIMKELLPKQVN